MLRQSRRSGLALFVCCGLVFGCESTGTPHRYQNDPLVLSKKPVPGKGDSVAPVLVACAEPEAPPFPQVYLASAPKSQEQASRTDSTSAKVSEAEPRSVPTPASNSMGSTEGPALLPPMSKSLAPAPVPVLPALQKKSIAAYAHAPDYGWLKGVVERHDQGQLVLRYCQSSAEDNWGGKVCLQEDSRLNQFKDGDVIWVSGLLVSYPPASGSWHEHRLYRVHELRLIHRP